MLSLIVDLDHAPFLRPCSDGGVGGVRTAAGLLGPQRGGVLQGLFSGECAPARGQAMVASVGVGVRLAKLGPFEPAILRCREACATRANALAAPLKL